MFIAPAQELDFGVGAEASHQARRGAGGLAQRAAQAVSAHVERRDPPLQLESLGAVGDVLGGLADLRPEGDLDAGVGELLRDAVELLGEGDIFGMQYSMDVVYNIGDAINKIGFGLVIYALAVKDSAKG